MIPTMGQGQTFCNITLQVPAPSRGLLYPLPEDAPSSYAGLSTSNLHQYPEEYIVSKIQL